ncbi:MAG TPA: ABC transporter permease [Bryobacteraceae bacterium]|nr:ABC transporter permease [Bryobacteraceae bacterium]
MRADFLFQAMLYCYPAAFRQEYGRQMELMFAEQMGDARRTGSLVRQTTLWLMAATDALTIAPKEHCHVIHQDLRYAFRVLATRPGFTAVAILSLALGIGANTAIFSLWNGVLHASLPAVSKPGELVMFSNPESAGGWHGDVTGDRDWLTYQEFEELRDQVHTLSGVMATQSFLSSWQVRYEGSQWEEAQGRLVSGGYFQVLGVGAALGRVFDADDDRTASPHAVISYAYWQRRFGGAPQVLGRTFTVRNAVLTIIGVTPPDFVGETVGQQPDVWIPLRMQPGVVPGEDWLHDTPPSKTMFLHVFGRLQPGITAARAEAEVNAVFHAGLESFYGAATLQERRKLLDQHLRARAAGTGASEARKKFSTSLTALLAGVGVLLLIACANLANLLLARGAARRSEMSLRLSLGASRGRLIRQLVTESLVLAVAGGLAGLATAYGVHGALVRLLVEADQDFRMGFAVDPLVLAFTLAVTLTAALLFGLLPAWQVTNTGTSTVLKEQGRGVAGGTHWGRSLVSLQLALSLPLLAGAGLLARTLYNLQHANLGYPAERLLLVKINTHEAGYDATRSAALFRQLAGDFQRIPGVRAVSFSENGIFTGSTSESSVQVEGFTPTQDKDRESNLDLVGPRYFATLGDSLILGRDILDSDGPNAPRVCVVNEAFARQFFAGRNPIGAGITAGDGASKTACHIVGVARNARTETLRDEVPSRFYVPLAQPVGSGAVRVTFLIRTADEHMPVLAAVRQAVQRVDASLLIASARTLEEQVTPMLAADRATAQLAEVFGCVALVLAAIGLYGVLSYGVARRRNEMAVRIALGARPSRVVAMVIRETAGLIAVGLAVGSGLVWAASKLIHTSLYGVAPDDPLTLTAAAGLLVAVALGAAYLPARNAARLDPMTALRAE